MPNNEDFVAFLVVTLFMLGNGLEPTKDFDADDPSCVRDNGRYRIWTFSSTVPGNSSKSLDVEKMNTSLSTFLNGLNKTYNFHFYPYNIEAYKWPDKKVIYVSIYN